MSVTHIDLDSIRVRFPTFRAHPAWVHGPCVQLRRGGADADTVRRLSGLER